MTNISLAANKNLFSRNNNYQKKQDKEYSRQLLLNHAVRHDTAMTNSLALNKSAHSRYDHDQKAHDHNHPRQFVLNNDLRHDAGALPRLSTAQQRLTHWQIVLLISSLRLLPAQALQAKLMRDENHQAQSPFPLMPGALTFSTSGVNRNITISTVMTPVPAQNTTWHPYQIDRNKRSVSVPTQQSVVSTFLDALRDMGGNATAQFHDFLNSDGHGFLAARNTTFGTSQELDEINVQLRASYPILARLSNDEMRNLHVILQIKKLLDQWKRPGVAAPYVDVTATTTTTAPPLSTRSYVEVRPVTSSAADFFSDLKREAEKYFAQPFTVQLRRVMEAFRDGASAGVIEAINMHEARTGNRLDVVEKARIASIVGMALDFSNNLATKGGTGLIQLAGQVFTSVDDAIRGNAVDDFDPNNLPAPTRFDADHKMLNSPILRHLENDAMVARHNTLRIKGSAEVARSLEVQNGSQEKVLTLFKQYQDMSVRSHSDVALSEAQKQRMVAIGHNLAAYFQTSLDEVTSALNKELDLRFDQLKKGKSALQREDFTRIPKLSIDYASGQDGAIHHGNSPVLQLSFAMGAQQKNLAEAFEIFSTVVLQDRKFCPNFHITVADVGRRVSTAPHAAEVKIVLEPLPIEIRNTMRREEGGFISQYIVKQYGAMGSERVITYEHTLSAIEQLLTRYSEADVAKFFLKFLDSGVMQRDILENCAPSTLANLDGFNLREKVQINADRIATRGQLEDDLSAWFLIVTTAPKPQENSISLGQGMERVLSEYLSPARAPSSSSGASVPSAHSSPSGTSVPREALMDVLSSIDELFVSSTARDGEALAETEGVSMCLLRTSRPRVTRTLPSVKCSDYAISLAKKLDDDVHVKRYKALAVRQTFGKLRQQRVNTEHEIATEYPIYKVTRAQKKEGRSDTAVKELATFEKRLCDYEQKILDDGVKELNALLDAQFEAFRADNPEARREDYMRIPSMTLESIEDNRPHAKTPLLKLSLAVDTPVKNIAEGLEAFAGMILKNGVVKPSFVVEINDIGKPFLTLGEEKTEGVISVGIGRGEFKAKKVAYGLDAKRVKSESVYCVLLDGRPLSYQGIFSQAIEPLLDTVGEKRSADFLLTLMDTGEMDAGVLEEIKNHPDNNESINTLRGYLSAWVTMIHISEEQRTTGTGQAVLRVLQDFREYKKSGTTHLLGFEAEGTVEAGVHNAAAQPKIVSLEEILDPEKEVLPFMGVRGSHRWKAIFTTPEGQVTKHALENEGRTPSEGFFSPGSAQKRIRAGADGLINPRIRFDSPAGLENVAMPL